MLLQKIDYNVVIITYVLAMITQQKKQRNDLSQLLKAKNEEVHIYIFFLIYLLVWAENEIKLLNKFHP